MASTAVYAVHGWTGVCLLGAGVSALAPDARSGHGAYAATGVIR